MAFDWTKELRSMAIPVFHIPLSNFLPQTQSSCSQWSEGSIHSKLDDKPQVTDVKESRASIWISILTRGRCCSIIFYLFQFPCGTEISPLWEKCEWKVLKILIFSPESLANASAQISTLFTSSKCTGYRLAEVFNKTFVSSKVKHVLPHHMKS